MTNYLDRIICGDCLEVMRGLPDGCVDAVVTDPPYGLSFMGKDWDHGVPGEAFWREALRVAKPGAHLLAFGGTRTHHRLMCAIEDAGWEIRDMIAWVYGSGFPKSLDVSKAIDKDAGRIGQSVIDLKRRLIALADASGMTRAAIDDACGFRATNYLTLPAEGKRPDPWVNCLPPRDKWAIMKRVLRADDSLDEVFTHAERAVVGKKKAAPGVAFSSEGPTQLEVTAPATDAARQWQGWGTALKPALEPITVARKPLVGTVAANVLQHGTGALNIDGCRVETEESLQRPERKGLGVSGGWSNYKQEPGLYGTPKGSGRFPANLIHDGSDEVEAVFPVTGKSNVRPPTGADDRGKPGFVMRRMDTKERGVSDNGGSASRFFYCAKASSSERGEGNNHPTVKPQALMQYLCRLVTPPGGVVLDPFAGSGSTLLAALKEGFCFIGIEMEEKYCEIARRRVAEATPSLFKEVGV